MQVGQQLLVAPQVVLRRGLLGQLGEAELFVARVVSAASAVVAAASLGRRGSTYLRGRGAQGRPVEARQHVDEHFGVDLELVAHELGVLGVQRERRRRAPAGLGGAREEVEAQDLHG